MTKKYKFETAHDWFHSWLSDRPDSELFQIALLLAQELDSDTIQDLFQADMIADGYFEEEEETENGAI